MCSNSKCSNQPFFPRLCSDDNPVEQQQPRRESKTKADRSRRCLHFTRAVEEEAKAEKATATVGDYDVDICNNDNNDHIIGNVVDNNNIDIDDDGRINIDDRETSPRVGIAFNEQFFV